MHCSSPRPNSIAHGEAYGRGISVRGRQRPQGRSWSLRCLPLNDISRPYARSYTPYALSCENMTSSTKPEVHNVLHCLQTRTELPPQPTCIESLVKFGHVVSGICGRTDTTALTATIITKNNTKNISTWPGFTTAYPSPKKTFPGKTGAYSPMILAPPPVAARVAVSAKSNRHWPIYALVQRERERERGRNAKTRRRLTSRNVFVVSYRTRSAAQFPIRLFQYLWPPCIADEDIILLSCFFLSFFFSSPNLSGRRLDVYHTSTHDVVLVRI